jgi:hypothetical protein
MFRLTYINNYNHNSNNSIIIIINNKTSSLSSSYASSTSTTTTTVTTALSPTTTLSTNVQLLFVFHSFISIFIRRSYLTLFSLPLSPFPLSLGSMRDGSNVSPM